MAIFRCKRSGNTVSFNDEADIVSMRTLEHYEEVIDVSRETVDETNLQIKEINHEIEETSKGKNADATNANENADENAEEGEARMLKRKPGRPRKYA